jgi:hypothetical protein
MQPTDVAFLSAHPDEPLRTVYNAVQSLGSQARPEEQTVPEILAHMRDVLSHMGNGDYLIARIDEVLAARAIELENIAGENRKLRAALMAVQFPESQQAPPERSQGQPEADLPPERHIDTPDELLELLAGISSDPQVEGLSLAQKASSMALLHIAKTLPQISYQLEDIDTALEQIGIWLSDGTVPPQEEVPEGHRGTGPGLSTGSPARTIPEWQAWAKDKPELARTFADLLFKASGRRAAIYYPVPQQPPGAELKRTGRHR